jgi:HEPN superfamily Swt1-like protein
LTNPLNDIREWMFRGLMFEAEAERFRQAGIRIGADLRDVESSLLEAILTPFSVDLRNDALHMARLYTLMYCFENSVRDLVRDRLSDKHGSDWWDKKVPGKVKTLGESRKKAAEDNSWLQGQNTDLLTFVEFGDLASIIIANWEDFSDLIPTQPWVKQRMDELEKARNYIAHNRVLLPGEFQRVELYITDWNRMVGF